MKKGMRLIAVLSAAALLAGGCGTPMYELTEDEETLITQYAAYAVGKYNIRQKDGMNGSKPAEDEAKKEQQTTEQQPETTDTADVQNPEDAPETGSDAASTYEEVSLAKALGYDSVLTISYKGYKLEDVYKEGRYFSVNASQGNTLLVMKFTIKNPGKKPVKYDTSSLGNTFYGMFDGENQIAEKMTFSNKELSSSTKTLKAGKKTGAVMIFELTKEQAAAITTEDLLVEMDGATYRVKM